MKHVNEPLGGSAPREDPFGDLVRAVEGGGARAVAPAPVYGGFEPVEIPPQSDWDSFTYERASAAARRPGAASGSLVAPVVASAAPAEMRVDPADVDWQIDEALRGLSSPARPRVTAPAETQSFAPARQADDHPAQAGRTLDDFDELIASELAAMRTAPVVESDDDDYGYDDEDDQPPRRAPRVRSAVMLVGGLAAAVVVGAVGVMAWSGSGSMVGGGSGDNPLLIKADSEPFKIAPADPGGRAIPNQNKAVYERVAGAPDAAPTQHELVTAIEEPLEIAEDEPVADELPGVEVDDVALPGGAGPAAAQARAPENETLQPRKVRTLTVRPDGTLVATDVPADTAGVPATLQASVAQASVLDPVAGIAPTMPFARGSEPGDDAAITTASTVAPEPAAAPDTTAAAAPTAPVREASIADAPRVGEGFFVQISSQPSEAAARDSMSSLTRRFSSQIGARGVGIRTAEIPGKGTFYRVRVATQTRDEAVTLCETLKSAGGSCFVTR